MNKQYVRRLLGALFAVMMFATANGAHAGLFRTYLSVNGNDANPCTVAAPCRLLPAALAAVNDGGEVWMLDSGNFNTGTVSITKSVTILAVPGALGSIVAANYTDAIFIDTVGVKVTLRNLNVLNIIGSSNYGVYMGQGAALTVEDCEIYGLRNGITARAANSIVAIRNTVIRDTTVVGAYIQGAVKATLDGVQLLNATVGLNISSGASAVVSNSLIAGNSIHGVLVDASAGSTARLVVASSVINANGTGISGTTGSGADTTSVTLQHNSITGNATGVGASAAGSSTLRFVLDGNALTDNTTAIAYAAPAVVFSRGNNSIKNNGIDIAGPLLTSKAGQ